MATHRISHLLHLFTESSLADTSKDSTEKDLPVLGEGGSTGDFPVNTSVVFAALEVCLCAIVRHIPALNPSAGTTGFQPPTHLTKMSSETFELIAAVMELMTDLLGLCSPTGEYKNTTQHESNIVPPFSVSFSENMCASFEIEDSMILHKFHHNILRLFEEYYHVTTSCCFLRVGQHGTVVRASD